MSDAPIHLTPTGPPETVIADEPALAIAALADAMSQPVDARRESVADVVARWPRFLDGWARLSQLGRDPVERYAYARVGYHRGLDALRASGWRGSGYVRWEHESNRGFLRALEGLRAASAEIGEVDEEERCAHFLRQCDPAWPPPDLD
jgi:hypothetical protein